MITPNSTRNVGCTIVGIRLFSRSWIVGEAFQADTRTCLSPV